MLIVAGFGLSTLVLTFEVLFPKSKVDSSSVDDFDAGDAGDSSVYVVRSKDYYSMTAPRDGGRRRRRLNEEEEEEGRR